MSLKALSGSESLETPGFCEVFHLEESLLLSVFGCIPFPRVCREVTEDTCLGVTIGFCAQRQPKRETDVQAAMVAIGSWSGDGVDRQRPWVSSWPSLACSHCLYFSPILGAVNLRLYLQPQQGAHFHRREDPFNESSSFVQEWYSH